MLLAIEFPDAAGDAVAGKRTLVVRLGALPAARLYAALTIAGFGALPLLARRARCRRAWRWRRCVLAPIAIWQAVRVVRGAYARSGALGERRVLVGGAADRQRRRRAGRRSLDARPPADAGG